MNPLNAMIIAACIAMPAAAAADSDLRWGDLGDGTFANPVLNADYSDPDVIRVGNKYYMTCSEFHYMGMLILESDDMVNWHIISRVYDSIDLPGYSDMTKYASGTWAPALRYHDGKFWIFVCTPDEGLFMTTASNPTGPWEPLHLVKGIEKWEDPCPFWDDDGTAYLGRSRHGAGPIILHRMSPDGRELLDDGVEVYRGPVAEGTKIFKRDGYYYMSIPEGGVSKGWQTVLRSKNIYGPYESRRVLERGSTEINGPHQGALVDTPDGEWWFYHFQSAGPRGRVLHLQPVVWRDGFPEIGTDYDGNGVGEPMKVCRKPSTGVSGKPYTPQSSDEFSGMRPGIQWQFNHNPDSAYISVSDGWLNITPMKSPRLRTARNQLVQKIMGYRSSASTKVDFSRLPDGGRCGIVSIGKRHIGAGVENLGGKRSLYMEIDSIVERHDLPENCDTVYLRLDIDTEANVNQYHVSIDGEHFMPLGSPFETEAHDWKGNHIGLYCYTTGATDGKASFDYFRYTHDGPASLPQ